MAYQRTEYADKTLSMNSRADRKLKIQLESINCHKGTIGKEIDREKKKIKKELAEAEEYMKKRLSVGDIPTGPEKRLSPRLPRRYSTPPATLLATLPARNLPEVGKRMPNPNRSLSGSEALLLDIHSKEPAVSDAPLSPRSPTSTHLKLPFNQPRRQSLPPISSGGLLAYDSRELSGRAKSPSGMRRGSSSGSVTPRNLSRRGSAALFEAESAQMEEVTSKVNTFLKRLDNKNEQGCNEKSAVHAQENFESECNNRLEAYEGSSDMLPRQIMKRTSSSGLFQPANFE